MIEGPTQARDERGPDQESWEEGPEWPCSMTKLFYGEVRNSSTDPIAVYGAKRIARRKARLGTGEAHHQ